MNSPCHSVAEFSALRITEYLELEESHQSPFSPLKRLMSSSLQGAEECVWWTPSPYCIFINSHALMLTISPSKSSPFPFTMPGCKANIPSESVPMHSQGWGFLHFKGKATLNPSSRIKIKERITCFTSPKVQGLWNGWDQDRFSISVFPSTCCTSPDVQGTGQWQSEHFAYWHFFLSAQRSTGSIP